MCHNFFSKCIQKNTYGIYLAEYELWNLLNRKGIINMKNIIVTNTSGEIEVKKSRFIAHILPVESEEEANNLIAEYKKKYWDARHNCFAYIVGENKRFSDDGEPSGTAGKPMMDVLEGRKLDKILVIVTRYFGGVLLGTGPLAKAYKDATIEGLNNAVVSEIINGKELNLYTDYTNLGKIQYIASNSDAIITDTVYLDTVSLRIVCPDDFYDSFINKLNEACGGNINISATKNIQYITDNKTVSIL